MQNFKSFQLSKIFLLYAFLTIKIRANFCEIKKYYLCFRTKKDNLGAIFEQLLKAM